jgi:hypothetical protein
MSLKYTVLMVIYLVFVWFRMREVRKRIPALKEPDQPAPSSTRDNMAASIGVPLPPRP